MAWYLRKHDTKQLYQCDTLDEVRTWAFAAQVNPFDDLSEDGRNWQPAYEYPELGMFWMATLADGTNYGPTNIPTLREFVDAGLLPGDAICNHRNTHQQCTARDLIDGRVPAVVVIAPLVVDDADIPPDGLPSVPRSTSIASQTKRLTTKLMSRLQPEWKTSPLPMPPSDPPPLPHDAVKPPC